MLGELDDYLMREGTHRRLWEKLGAHAIEHQGVAGVHFAVWAPNASRVSVVGDFNGWDGRRNVMRTRAGSGVRAETAPLNAQPTSTPAIPPTKASTTASTRNWVIAPAWPTSRWPL